MCGIELIDSAINIKEYIHPGNCIYLLGAEDNGLSPAALKGCDDIIKLPGSQSLNVSVAGSIVLYDRISRISRIGV